MSFSTGIITATPYFGPTAAASSSFDSQTYGFCSYFYCGELSANDDCYACPGGIGSLPSDWGCITSSCPGGVNSATDSTCYHCGGTGATSSIVTNTHPTVPLTTP